MAKTFQTKFKQAKTTVDQLGNTQLKVGKRFKLSGWLLFDGIVLIIIISVATLRLTHAGVDYTFTRTAQDMTGGTLKHSVVAGDYRQLVAAGIHAESSAAVSSAQVAASSKVCADIHVTSKDTFVDIQLNGHYASSFVTRAGDVTVCASVKGDDRGGTVYAGTSGKANVYSIYGTR